MSTIGKLANPLPLLSHAINPVQMFKDVKKNPRYALITAGLGMPMGTKPALDQLKDTGRAVSGYIPPPGNPKNERGLWGTAPAPPVIPLPDPGDSAARRRSATARRSASGTGRANTIFSESSGSPLGGG